ncbi:MAG: hypothetical protein IAX21_06355 [Candidatus Bathyarchaeota archaeon]|nr:hypothetical protein [Candidatus Bathyarchaeum tardum]WGM89426.1 MAG: hypothetical protein NUK63_11075 [Candidatus Bathyarchaeum tardum]WNZ28296.1 MAG: hypothetical protein IAX21_06355 [Candidatus Bathyarchaeota archaeon]
MNGKKFVLILGLVALVIAIPISYVLAHPGGYYYNAADVEHYQNEEWWQEMRQYMEQRWDDNAEDEWWNEMREHMEQRRWEGAEDEKWFQEMKQYMEERWEDQDYYGRYGGNGGFGRCHRWNW